jgi:hypothetical protein
MWGPRRLTTLPASTACYRDSFTYIGRMLHPRRWSGLLGVVFSLWNFTSKHGYFLLIPQSIVYYSLFKFFSFAEHKYAFCSMCIVSAYEYRDLWTKLAVLRSVQGKNLSQIKVVVVRDINCNIQTAEMRYLQTVKGCTALDHNKNEDSMKELETHP